MARRVARGTGAHSRSRERGSGRSVTLRFASANYVADVWLNGTWIGYHEGGATPFAIQAGESLLPGTGNVLAVRVHTIPRGTRHDVVPWGATDWWNYGGLTGSVWLEAAPAIHIARADVVPHLDAVEVEVLISQAAELGGLAPPESDTPAGIPAGMPAMLRATIHAASVNPDNLLDPDPRGLVTDLADPLLVVEEEVDPPRRRPGDRGAARPAVRRCRHVEPGDTGALRPARPAPAQRTLA